MDINVGDTVRINHQQHPFCGFYGSVTEMQEQGEMLSIQSEQQIDLINPDRKMIVSAFKSQVEVI